MTRILLMEGNSLAHQSRVARLGVRSGSDTYISAIRGFFPDLEIDVLHGADKDQTPRLSLSSYDGMIIAGSALHVYDESFEVLNQIEWIKSFAQTGRPILGSCWGLQIAIVAAGGKVAPNIKGREIGFARKIQLSDDGKAHCFMAGKSAVFDAPCIHFDEIAELPDGATVLASNSHSPVQAAVFNLGNSEVWGVQYHPEFDLKHLSDLVQFSQAFLIAQGYFEDLADFKVYRSSLEKLAAQPDTKALAWQLGIDEDITNPAIRCAEIINWIKRLG